MKPLLPLVACAVFVAACCAKPTPQTPSKIEAAENLRSKTVALLKENEEGNIGSFCSGVWVSGSTILTAAHCMEGTNLGSLHYYSTPSDVFDNDTYRYRPTPIAHGSNLYAQDFDHDICLLRAPNAPDHSVVDLTRYMPRPGMFAQTMSNPLGLYWSYASGDVAGVRFLPSPTTGKGMLFVQTTVPISPGSSGGGLFDEDGTLIGLSNSIADGGQVVNFFVHPWYIRALLKAQGDNL